METKLEKSQRLYSAEKETLKKLIEKRNELNELIKNQNVNQIKAGEVLLLLSVNEKYNKSFTSCEEAEQWVYENVPGRYNKKQN